MMGRDALFSESIGELMREALGHAPGVHEDERRLMVLDLRGDRVEDLPHLLAGRDGLELATGQDQLEVEGARVPRVDDRADRLSVRTHAFGPDAHEQLCHELDRPLGRREPDPRRPLVAEGVQSFERERQVGAAFVPRHRVDLVDDHRSYRPEDLAPACRGQQQVE